MHRSRIVNGLEAHLPPQPPLFSRIGTLLTEAGLPPVFAGLEPSPAAPVTGPPSEIVARAAAAAREGTVMVIAQGCGQRSNGSGFVAGPGLVETNAHVIAGMDDVSVVDSTGRRRRAHPVLFDPGLDVAILRSPSVAGRPLSLLRDVVERGTAGAVLGFPGGAAFRARPAAVRTELVAVGRDIYGRALVTRSVYQLQADVRPGSSGGPFVDPDGDVMGVVFSRSVLSDDVGYALTSAAVVPLLEGALGRTAPVDSGACIG